MKLLLLLKFYILVCKRAKNIEKNEISETECPNGEILKLWFPA